MPASSSSPRNVISSLSVLGLVGSHVVQANITPRAPAAAASTAAAGDLATVSITAAAGYQVAGSCIQESLFWNEFGVAGGLGLPAELGCYKYQQPTVYNGCYCTSVVAAKASSIISVYVSELCSGTAQIPDAISIYKDYCTSAGYPSAAVSNPAKTTSPANNNKPVTSVIATEVVYTFTIGTSVMVLTEPGFATVTSSPPTTSQAGSSSSTSSSDTAGGTGTKAGKKKVNVAAIVAGILGGLLVILLAIAGLFFWRRKGNPMSKARVDPQPLQPAQPGGTFVPGGAGVGVQKRQGGGRAELAGEEKGPMVAEEKEVGVGREVGGHKEGADLSAQGQRERERVELEGRYGLRAEELDSQGRYVGELHGDGRQGGGFELEGREVR